MKTLSSIFELDASKDILPYAAKDINSVMIDFILGQLPEQSILSEDEDIFAPSGQLHSVDTFLHIFGEPKTKKVFGDNYLFYYPLQDSKTLVISVDAFAYDINRILINDYAAY